MSSLWGTTKSYSSYVKQIATGTGAATAKGTRVYLAGVTSTRMARLAATKAAAAASVAAAAGTIAGQGVNYMFSRWWDPVDAMYATREMKDVARVSEPEFDLFIYQFLDMLGMPFEALADDETSEESLVFIGSAVQSVRVGAQLFVELARGAEASTRRDPAGFKRHLASAQENLRAYIASLESLAKASEGSEIQKMVGGLDNRNHSKFISDCKNEGKLAIPSAEGHFIQMLFDLAGVRPPFDDFRDDLAKWVAEGSDEEEMKAFERHRGTLPFGQMVGDSIDFYWKRIDFSESPLISGAGSRR